MKCKWCPANKRVEFAESYEVDDYCLLGVEDTDTIEFKDGEEGCNRRSITKIEKILRGSKK